MEEQERRNLEMCVDMFGTEGWKFFMAKMKDHFGMLQETAFTECDTSEKWQIRRGQMYMATQILGWEDGIRKALEPQEYISYED